MSTSILGSRARHAFKSCFSLGYSGDARNSDAGRDHLDLNTTDGNCEGIVSLHQIFGNPAQVSVFVEQYCEVSLGSNTLTTANCIREHAHISSLLL